MFYSFRQLVLTQRSCFKIHFDQICFKILCCSRPTDDPAKPGWQSCSFSSHRQGIAGSSHSSRTLPPGYGHLSRSWRIRLERVPRSSWRRSSHGYHRRLPDGPDRQSTWATCSVGWSSGLLRILNACWTRRSAVWCRRCKGRPIHDLSLNPRYPSWDVRIGFG